MTTRDIRSIYTLYYFHRYLPSSIARIYGVSPKHIKTILSRQANESLTVIAEYACQLCSNEDAVTYFIDGDADNEKPQNIIMLCEPDKRKVQHLQLRRRRGLLTPQFAEDSTIQSIPLMSASEINQS